MQNKNDFCNIPQSIENKVGINLHNKINHPINIIKDLIYQYFDTLENYQFNKYDNLSPYVSVEDNFDKLRIEKDHPARSKSDTYYVNENTVLRTQTSAHQNELFEKGIRSFLVTGDVYRKDEIDRCHYPVFHQMEGVSLVGNNVDPKDELIKVLTGLVKFLFPGCEYRTADDYFPFTEPSYEIEVKYNDEWLEILGCGVTHREILDRCHIKENAWAFGLGLDRLAMILFKIPDIRYIWTDDNKFLDQFANGINSVFEPYSNLDPVYKDISFFLPNDRVTNKDSEFSWEECNYFFEWIRDIGDDLIESVLLFDKYYNKKINKYSHTYRLKFSPLYSMKDPSLLTKKSNRIADELRNEIGTKFNVELR